MNKLFQQMQNQNPYLANIKGMMKMMRSANNPQALMQSMMNKNPQMKQAMDLIQQNGGDAKTAFYNLAKQKGVNPDDILNQLK